MQAEAVQNSLQKNSLSSLHWLSFFPMLEFEKSWGIIYSELISPAPNFGKMKPPMEFSTRIILLYWALDFSCTLNNEGPTTISTKQELDFSPFVFSTSVQNILFFF